jgi:hypothetical protein
MSKFLWANNHIVRSTCSNQLDNLTNQLVLQSGIWLQQTDSPEEMVSQFLLNTEPRIGSRNSFIVQINTTEDLKAFSGLKIDQMVYFITKKDEIV